VKLEACKVTRNNAVHGKGACDANGVAQVGVTDCDTPPPLTTEGNPKHF